MLRCLENLLGRLATKVTYHTLFALATSARPLRTRQSRLVRQSKAVSSSRKPVVLRRFSREWCAGYAETTFQDDSPELEILDVSGKLTRFPWASIKWVCYVRELTGASGMDGEGPERLIRRRFASRPRSAGLWLRVVFHDGEELEGLVANDRSLLHPLGLSLTPPDTRSNTQRVFVPRSAVRELTILAVIAPSTRSSAQSGAAAQPDLFAETGATDPS